MGIPVFFYKKGEVVYTISIWNRGSTNYDENEFVRTQGTGTVQMESKRAALMYAAGLKDDPLVDRVLIKGPLGDLANVGILFWRRPCGCDSNPDDCVCSSNEPMYGDCGGCSDAGHDPDPDDCGCDSGDCGNCDDCPGFDINDPRR